MLASMDYKRAKLWLFLFCLPFFGCSDNSINEDTESNMGYVSTTKTVKFTLDETTVN